MSTTTSPDVRGAGADASAGNGNGNGAGAANGGLATPGRRPGPQERTAFVACIVAIVVYLVLAYFVFVRPGVHREDHVLAVLHPGGHPRPQRGAVPAPAGRPARLPRALLRRDRSRHRRRAGRPSERRGRQRLRRLRPAAARGRRGAHRHGHLAGADLAQTRRAAVVDHPPPRAHRARGPVPRVLGRPARQPGHRRDGTAESGDQDRGPRAPSREGDADHPGRAEARRLVRALAQPRGDRHVPARLDHPSGADAGEGGLRRAPGGPARLRHERGRPQRLRLGLDARRRRRRGVAAPPSRRAAAAHRRPRPLDGRRGDDRGRRPQPRPQGCGERGRRHPLRPRVAAPPRAELRGEGAAVPPGPHADRRRLGAERRDGPHVAQERVAC